MNASLTWYGLRCLFSTPVWLDLNLSTAILFSRVLKPFAVTGESGSMMNIMTPQQQHKAPMMRNSYFHEGKEPCMWPMPYPRRPPKAIPKPFAVYHNPMRTGCCFLVYHMDVMSIKLGSEQASAAPARARRTPSVAKL